VVIIEERITLENTRMSRDVEIDAFHRTNRSEYTAVTAQSALRAGYEWQAGDLRFGTTAGLDYGLYHRPPVSETGDQATRLQLEATSFHALRSALGGAGENAYAADQQPDAQGRTERPVDA